MCQMGHYILKLFAQLLWAHHDGSREVETRPIVALTFLWKCEVRSILTIL